MTLELQSLADVPQTDFDDAYALLVRMLQDAYPSLDLKRGAVHDLVLYPSAALAAANQVNIDRVRRSNSLLAIEDDPSLVDDDVLDRLASNYRVTRLAATAATGTIAVVLSSQISVVIAQGTRFTDAAGNAFTADDTYTSVATEEEVLADTDRLLTAVGDGTYSFVINLTAETGGTAGNVARLTAMTPDAEPPSFVEAYAASDFTGGVDEESNDQLFARIKTSWTVRSLASRSTIDGLIREQEGYEGCATSTIGFGDQEQRRAHTIFPVTVPGRVDVYVRPVGLWRSVQLTKTATFVGTDGGYGVWEFILERDDAPGYYELDRVTQLAEPSASGYEISSEVRGYDVSEGTADRHIFLPDVRASDEAAYTAYQTATVRFVDIDTPVDDLTEGESTQDYAVAVKMLPDLELLQDVVSARARRNPSGDCLVRAAVPCFVSAEIALKVRSGATEPDEAAIQQACAEAVNATGFIGLLQSSVLASAAASALSAGSWVDTVTLTGRVRRPDGTEDSLSGTSLDPGSDPELMVTSRTVGFFLDPDDVTVTSETVDAPEP